MEVPAKVNNYALYVCKDKPSADTAVGLLRGQSFTQIFIQEAKNVTADTKQFVDPPETLYEDVDMWVVYGYKT